MIDDRTMQRLLEADIAELEGYGDTDTARLIREQEIVRAVAHRILTGLREADAAIGHIAAERSAPQSARHAGASAFALRGSNAAPQPHRPAHPVVDGSAPARHGAASGRRSRSVLAPIGVAAAAITLLVLADTEPDVSPAPAAADEPMTATLNVSSSRPFAVFPTDNPDIAIVWLFDEEER